MEVDREKLNSLTAIFGGDIPVHIISDALVKHKNNLEETLNYLLERKPESTIQPSQQQQPQQPAQPQQRHKDQEDLRALQNMFGHDLTQSVIATVLHSNSGDVSNAVDELLTITSKEMQPPQPVPAPPRDLDQTRRMQREIQEMEEFKRLQQRMQEEELRLAEETRRAAEYRVREREQRAVEEQMRRTEEKRATELLQLEKARIAAELSLKEELRRQELMAAEIKAQEELAALRISEKMREMDLQRKSWEEEKQREQQVREQEEALRRMSLEAEEKRRREAIKEEEVAIKRRLEEEEFATKRRLEEEELTRIRALEEKEFQQRRVVEIERARYEAEKHRLAAERAQLAIKEEATIREKERLVQVAQSEEAKRRQEDEQRNERLKEESRRMREEIRRQFMEDEERRQAEEEARKRKIAEDQFDESVVILPAVSSANVELVCEVKDDVVSVTWSLPASSASPSDWIGIHSIHNNNKYEQYFKTGGADAGSHDFKGLAPGYHIVHFYPKGTWAPACSSAPLRIGSEAAVTVKVEGDQIRINYSPSATPARDWIGIYEPSQRNKNYLFTTYGNVNGELLVAAPRPVGQYEARVFYAGSNYNEQCKTTFTIVDNDRISCTPTTVEQGATLRAEYVMRTKEPSSYNWIGLFRTDEKDNTKYIVSTYISTATVGGCDIVVPKDLAAGCYELRLFVASVGKYETFKTSNLFNVVAASPSK